MRDAPDRGVQLKEKESHGTEGLGRGLGQKKGAFEDWRKQKENSVIEGR